MCIRIVPLKETKSLEKIYNMLQKIEENENEFQNQVKNMDYTDFLDWVQKMIDWERGINLPKGYVRQSIYIAYDGETVVGIGKIRHELTPMSEKSGGTLGYAISEEKRGKGYGTQLMGLLIDEAKKMNIKDLLATVKHNNIASKKAIEKSGGKYIKSNDEFDFYTF